MAPGNFRAIFPPSEKKYAGPADFRTYFFRDLFSIEAWLTMGALCQTVAFLLLPARYALVPVALLALRSVLSTVVQTLRAKNDYNYDVAQGRTTAQPPSVASYDPDRPEDRPVFGAKPAPEPLVVFHLGFRSNHALGPFAPGVKEVGDHFEAMTADLAARAKHYGSLGQSTWRAADRANHNASLTVFYFRNVEGINAFAHDPIHRKGWDWYNKFVKETGYRHIGIFHETFSVAPGQYETIYDSMPPLLLGRTNWPLANEKTGKDEWTLPLVDCNISTLRGQYNRLGRTKASAEQAF